MSHWPIYGRIEGPIVMIGFGSIGKGTLPLIERHFEFDKDRFTVIDPNDADRKLLDERGVKFVHLGLTKDNYRDVLRKYLKAGEGRRLLRQPVGRHLLARYHARRARTRRALRRHRGRAVARLLLRQEPRQRGAHQLRAARDGARGAAQEPRRPDGGVLLRRQSRHGVVVRQAGPAQPRRRPRRQGARAEDPRGLGASSRRTLGVKGVHIAERDTQRAKNPKPRNVFVNTWSVEGFLSEGMQPAELGWGTHEKWAPANAGFHATGCGAAIYLDQPGANTRVRSWTPTARGQFGFLVTHNEAISIADYYTVRDDKGEAVYRPTCHYAYHPCDDAVLSLHELFGRAGQVQSAQHILTEAEIVGRDRRARRAALRPRPQRLLVRLAALGRGDARPRALSERDRHAGDFGRARRHGLGAGEPRAPASSRPTSSTSAAASRSSAPISARWSASTPTGPRSQNRPGLFPEDIDETDPWQFRNVLVR